MKMAINPKAYVVLWNEISLFCKKKNKKVAGDCRNHSHLPAGLRDEWIRHPECEQRADGVEAQGLGCRGDDRHSDDLRGRAHLRGPHEPGGHPSFRRREALSNEV